MSRIVLSFTVALLIAASTFFVASQYAMGTPPVAPKVGFGIQGERRTSDHLDNFGEEKQAKKASPKTSRSIVLMASFTFFLLSMVIGSKFIAKVPPNLHTPMMSGCNAISGIIVVGAIIAAGNKEAGVGGLLGLVAIILAMINVVGGFVLTHRMLLVFPKN